MTCLGELEVAGELTWPTFPIHASVMLGRMNPLVKLRTDFHAEMQASAREGVFMVTEE